MPRLYLETSVVSYLTARPSSDIITAAHQLITTRWWSLRRTDIAAASVHAVEYLLTWNCSHIANAERLPHVTALVEEAGFAMPFVCTPEELLGDTNDQ